MIHTLTNAIRRLKGGSQPYLMSASDGNDYVVKFQNNPQGTGILINELLSARLLNQLGLPVPEVRVLELKRPLAGQLGFETLVGQEPIRPGLHFGSRLVVKSLEGRCYDFLPWTVPNLIRNEQDFCGIAFFDSWACNCDSRQAVYWKYCRSKKYTATFIDHGHCLGGPEHLIHGSPMPTYSMFDRYSISSWNEWRAKFASFAFWKMKKELLSELPSEWCGDRQALMNGIFDCLADRQATLRSAELSNGGALGSFDVPEEIRSTIGHVA